MIIAAGRYRSIHFYHHALPIITTLSLMDMIVKVQETPSPVNSISFCPAPHSAVSFGTGAGFRLASAKDPSLALLRAVAPEQGLICSEILHTSNLPKNSDAMWGILPQGNGFVHTVLEAYNGHHALIIRPDDVWLAILTQFSFFVNGNAEALRSTFVAHQGKRELTLLSGGNRYTMNPAHITLQMTELMQEHILDPSLREWIIPTFTTTTATDRTISAITMMAAMKEYFELKVSMLCGIPKVTIEGEKSDWEEILRRLERLKRYGVLTSTWCHLLRPIISRFVAAYDDPSSSANIDFWSKVAHRTGNGSEPRWLSGWITAFCVFDKEGQWRGNTLKKGSKAGDFSRFSAEKFASAYIRTEDAPYLSLDGIPYPTINADTIPRGYAYVDLKLDDNGVLLDTMFVAGLVGSQICTTEMTELSPNGTRNAIRPFPAWWYFIKDEELGFRKRIFTPSDAGPAKEVLPLHQNITSRMKGAWDTLRRK